jgi:hypothetical protein
MSSSFIASLLETELVIRHGLAEFGRAFPVRHGIQRGIDEARLIAGKEIMRDADILVDHHLGRHIFVSHQLETGGQQDGAQD